MATNAKPLSIDLFCGVGGMSLGFEQAGFRVSAAFDIEQRHVDTYNENFPDRHAHCVNLKYATASKVRELANIGSEPIDVLFGGPPCQGFSIGGDRNSDDPRNRMVMTFARFVRELKPRYFVMENVRGLLQRHSESVLNPLRSALRAAGYATVEPIQALDAAEFGVPQRRARAFVIGCRDGLVAPEYPKPRGIVIDGDECFASVSEAIDDLPDIERHDSLLECDDFRGQLGDPSLYAKLMRGEIEDPEDRSPKRSGNDVLTGCLRTRHAPSVVKRFARTDPGDRESISRFFRLNADAVAPTIRAGTGSERGRFTAPRPIHHRSPRCITVREGARLFGYPDWFRFHETRWHAFRQLGNSVPPLLARAVALGVLTAIRQSTEPK